LWKPWTAAAAAATIAEALEVPLKTPV
jgi:hypothetical protein